MGQSLIGPKLQPASGRSRQLRRGTDPALVLLGIASMPSLKHGLRELLGSSSTVLLTTFVLPGNKTLDRMAFTSIIEMAT